MRATRLCVLGGFRINIDGVVTDSLSIRKGAILLTYLSLHPGMPQSREKLATLLWENNSSAHARASLRQALSSLRRLLQGAPPIIDAQHDWLALKSENLTTDVADFEKAIRSDNKETLAYGVSLYRGDLLESIDVESSSLETWLIGERHRLRASAVAAMLRLLEQRWNERAIEPSIALALKLLVLDPTQEPVHRALMRLYAESGLLTDALRHFERCRVDLARELGVEPELETTELYNDIRRRRRLSKQNPHLSVVSRNPQEASMADGSSMLRYRK